MLSLNCHFSYQKEKRLSIGKFLPLKSFSLTLSKFSKYLLSETLALTENCTLTLENTTLTTSFLLSENINGIIIQKDCYFRC